MAQKYNPETGLWEEDEEDSTLSSVGSSTFGGAPDLGTNTQMTGPQYGTSAFNYNQLPSGYQWGEEGYTKSYKDPYATTYDLMGADGKSIGTGYDTLEDALRKSAFTSGIRPSSLGSGYTHTALDGQSGVMMGSTVDEMGNSILPPGGAESPTYNTKTDLYNALMQTNGSPLTLESREKYGRPLIEQQYQEALGQYLTGVGPAAVEDWTYHRDATGNQIADNITGSNTMYGTTPLIGRDPVTGEMKVLGRKLNLDPGTIDLQDLDGRVTSGSRLYRSYNPGAENSLQAIDDKTGYISEDKIKDFAGWKNVDDSFYNKEESGFSALMSKLVPMAIAGLATWGIGSALGGFGAGALEGGAISAAEASAAMGGGIDALGWGSGALDVLGGASASNFATGLDTLFSNPGFSGADFIGNGNAFNSLDLASSGNGVFNAAAESFGYPESLSQVSGVSDLTDPFATTESVNKGFSKLTGYGLNDPYGKGISGLPTGTEGEIKNMWNTMTQPMGGGAKGPSPLDALYKGGKAFMDYRSNQDAMDMYKKQMALASAGADPNRGRGNTANALWEQNWQDPKAGMAEFMGGAGRKFVDQARAAAAQGGRRGSYLNSGKINSDLASLYLQNQNARGNALAQGFERPSNTNAQILNSMGPILDMKKNEYAPFGQAIDYIRRGTDLASGAKGLKDIYDLISGW